MTINKYYHVIASTGNEYGHPLVLNATLEQEAISKFEAVVENAKADQYDEQFTDVKLLEVKWDDFGRVVADAIKFETIEW